MLKIAKLAMILLAVFAIALVILGYLDSSESKNKIVYYTACDGSRESVQDYNTRLQINARGAKPGGVNPGGLCLGEPVYGNTVTRPLLIPALYTFGVVLALEIGFFFEAKKKKRIYPKTRT